MNTIEGKTALITGASRGIGKGCALALARAGANIAVNYRIRDKEANETCSLIEGMGRRSLSVQADVSLETNVDHMFKVINRDLGTVEILVNNAGIAIPQPPHEIQGEDWDRMINVNLKSTFLVTRAFVPSMREAGWGRIINISSAAAQTGGVVGPHYAAAKAGIIGLTHYYAALLMKEGITVNAIAPGFIETEMVTQDLKAGTDLIPVGRFGTVDEIAQVVVMLANNGFITGQTIAVNGGRYMT